MVIQAIIPAYNEDGNLSELTRRLFKAARSLKIHLEVLYIIQGNRSALSILDQLKKKYNIEYLYYSKPLGIGIAYREGFNHMIKRATYVFTLDADLNHEPEELANFIRSIKKSGTDIVIGSRFIERGINHEKRTWKKFVSLFTNRFIAKLLKLHTLDNTSGFRLIKRDVITQIKKDLSEKGYPFYMEFILIATKYGFRITEIPIQYRPRTWGISKLRVNQTLSDYFIFLIKLPYRFLNTQTNGTPSIVRSNATGL